MEQAAKRQALSAEELNKLTVRCLVLPLYSMSLLVPNTVVAEVIEHKPAESASQLPKWITGMLPWRGRNIPVVSFERLLNQSMVGRGDDSRFVICNTLNGNAKVPFIALEVQGIPHLSLVANEMLELESEENSQEQAVLVSLRLNKESVIVPNLDVIEKMVEQLGIVAG
ncbi:MAG: chemotaxis protein CheW [Pseudomonadota bacterium]